MSDTALSVRSRGATGADATNVVVIWMPTSVILGLGPRIEDLVVEV
jgi:hypothetical protein